MIRLFEKLLLPCQALPGHLENKPTLLIMKTWYALLSTFGPIPVLPFCLPGMFCVQPLLSSGQTLQVLSSFSTEGQSQHFQMSCTVGEPVIWTGSSAQLVVTQGFQQPDYKDPIPQKEPRPNPWQLALWPNPAQNLLYLSFSPPHHGYLHFTVYDAIGHLAIGLTGLPPTGLFELNLSNLAPGDYNILAIDEAGRQAAFRFLIAR